MKQCRSCKSEQMMMFLPLGKHPPANAFLSAEQLATPEPSWPLNTHACLRCGLVQIPNVIPPDFFRHYLYVPSASLTMHRHFAALASLLVERYLNKPGALLVDIGCNDGLLLERAADLNVKTLGIEPAANLAEIARSKGIPVVSEYFNPQTADAARKQHGPAAVIVTTNTFNHIDDLHAFMKAVSILLADDGVFIVEVPQALTYVRHHEFDTIYHEHLSIFSVKSFVELARFFDMRIVDVQLMDIHGGSMRVFVRKSAAGHPVGDRITECLAEEEAAALFLPSTYEAFAVKVRRMKDEMMAELRRLRGQGARVAGYGAPAKGNTLLNYYEIGRDLLDYLVDKSSLKHGLYSPGMHLPIHPVERINQNRPDYLLLLAWNFADEIMEQQAAYARSGGRFIIPIPQQRILP